MTWIGKQDDIDAVNWGWSMQNHQLIPIMSQMTAAPESLLKIIHCNCSSACRTFRCSCRRYGLPCTAACGPCQLQNCDNLHNRFLPDKSEDGRWLATGCLIMWRPCFDKSCVFRDHSMCHSDQWLVINFRTVTICDNTITLDVMRVAFKVPLAFHTPL